MTALGLLLTIAAAGFILARLGVGAQPSETAAVPTASTQAAAPPAVTRAALATPQPTPTPGPPPGQGPLRTTERVLEPTYTVAPGDTLGSIAAKFGTTVEALQSINNLQDRNVLSVGQRLVIPNQP